MTANSNEPIMFKTAQPTLIVTDIEGAFQFYSQFGFRKRFQNEDVHLVIEKDGVILHLATYLFEGRCGCQIMVNDVDRLYVEVVRQAIKVKFEIQDEFWGCRDFTVEDPDGNYITFSQATESQAQ